jgi:predicted dehydrogenase
MAKKLRAAVVGCGRIGFEFDLDPKRTYVSTHAKAYDTLKDTVLAAVCDADPARLARCLEKYPHVRGYTSAAEMVRVEKPELLSICTPPTTHRAVFDLAVKAGVKGVFCEKPIAHTASEGKKMAAAAKKKKVILQIGHQRRFDSLHKQIRESIFSGKWGGLQQGNFYYTAGIYNTGSHMFDLLRFFFGDVKWVQAHYNDNRPRTPDPNLDGMLEFKSGKRFSFQAMDVKNYLCFEMNCFFEKARLVLRHSGFSVQLETPQASPYFSGYKDLLPAKSSLKTDYARNFMIEGIQELIRSVKTGKQSVSSGDDGVESLACIEAAVASAKRGGPKSTL